MEKKLPRILFVTHTASIGGPSNSLFMLTRYLKSCYDLAVLLPESGPLDEILAKEGVQTYIIPGLNKESILKVYKLIREKQFDLVYGNTPSACSRNAMLAARMARKPFIWHFRSIKRHWDWQDGFFLRWADDVIAVSTACAESIRRFYPHGEIHVIYNGVETAAFDGDRQSFRAILREELRTAPDSKIILSLSNVTPRKGIEFAVQIMSQVLENGIDAHLLIAGEMARERDYLAKIRELIRERRLEDRVHLLGLRTDVPLLLNSADVFLHTANRDPHPRAVIEAMAAGLPVVAFGVDGVAESVIDGVTGFLFDQTQLEDMARTISDLLSDPQTAEKMGQRGKEHVIAHFTAEATAQQISQVIAKHI